MAVPPAVAVPGSGVGARPLRCGKGGGWWRCCRGEPGSPGRGWLARGAFPGGGGTCAGSGGRWRPRGSGAVPGQEAPRAAALPCPWPRPAGVRAGPARSRLLLLLLLPAGKPALGAGPAPQVSGQVSGEGSPRPARDKGGIRRAALPKDMTGTWCCAASQAAPPCSLAPRCRRDRSARMVGGGCTNKALGCFLSFACS